MHANSWFLHSHMIDNSLPPISLPIEDTPDAKMWTPKKIREIYTEKRTNRVRGLFFDVGNDKKKTNFVNIAIFH